jgi:hypothetical protein
MDELVKNGVDFRLGEDGAKLVRIGAQLEKGEFHSTMGRD